MQKQSKGDYFYHQAMHVNSFPAWVWAKGTFPPNLKHLLQHMLTSVFLWHEDAKELAKGISAQIEGI